MLENPAMEAKPFYPSQQLFPTPMEQSTLKIYKTPNWLRKWRASDCFLVHLSRTRFFFLFFFTFPNFQTMASEGGGDEKQRHGANKASRGELAAALPAIYIQMHRCEFA